LLPVNQRWNEKGLFCRSLHPDQISTLKIRNVSLWLKFQPALILTKGPGFRSGTNDWCTRKKSRSDGFAKSSRSTLARFRRIQSIWPYV